MESRGSSDEDDEQIVQVREALMCPDGEKFQGLRTARFLNYTTASINDDVFELPLDAFACRQQEAIDPAKISFSGWGSPPPNWIEWVNAMAESHADVWKKSGVHDAVLASRYQIERRDGLVMALVEKWCIETNTFVFPWGEATVTLEDMVVLGGFSVIGNNAMAPIKRGDLKEVEEKMKKAKREIEGKRCCVSSWMKEMMNSGSEIEHEAFMVSWLSRFVFPNPADLLRDKLFPAAIQLANGVRLALAPAVLAGIYSDLGLLKEYLAGYSDKETVVVKSPFQFVQVWAYERIMELQPPGQPSQLKPGEPRIARWHHHGGGQDSYGYPENVRAVLDSAKESFEYRPYTRPLNNFKFPRFYLEDDCWVSLHSGDENIVAFGRCLRFSKLVGFDGIEPYYPHRVALQFGYDQDVPGLVPARIETPELAWKDYIRPISDEMLYIPARLHEADVTVEYIRWWKLSVEILQSEAEKIFQKLRASPPRQKPATITDAATTTTKATSLSPGKWKPSCEKTEGKDQELVKKREMETNKGTSVTGSKIEVNRAEGRGHGSSSYAGSLTKSEQATKHSLKKPEWVQRSSSMSTKSHDRSSGRAADDVKDKNSPSPQVSKGQYKSPSVSGSSSLSRKKSPTSPEAIDPRGNNNPPSPRVSKELNKSPSSSGCPSLTRKNSPRSPEAVKRITEISTTVSKQESSKKTHQLDISEASIVKSPEEIVTLREQVGEGGEVTYQIPKQQLENLSQGVQDVRQDLQSIKSALNIQDDDE